MVNEHKCDVASARAISASDVPHPLMQYYPIESDASLLYLQNMAASYLRNNPGAGSLPNTDDTEKENSDKNAQTEKHKKKDDKVAETGKKRGRTRWPKNSAICAICVEPGNP